MARYVTKIATGMSREAAFDFMADLENFAKWDPGVSKATRADDGPVGPDAAFAVEANGVELTYVLVEYDRPTRVVAEATTDRLRSHDVITVEDQDTGSVVTYDATLELRSWFKIFEPIMALVFRRIGSKADAGLRRALAGTKVA